MWGVALVDPITAEGLHTHNPFNGERILVTTTYAETHGQFKAITLTVEGTAIVTQPNPSGAVIITGFLISARKKNLGVVTVQFTDGVNTETIFSAELTNEAVNLSVPVVDGWRGWMDARLEVVLSGADTVVNVTSAYTKISGALTFSEWDGLR